MLSLLVQVFMHELMCVLKVVVTKNPLVSLHTGRRMERGPGVARGVGAVQHNTHKGL